MEESFYDNDFTEDEIACLKKMIYKFRQDEILELYNRRKMDYAINKTTASGSMPPPKRIIE